MYKSQMLVLSAGKQHRLPLISTCCRELSARPRFQLQHRKELSCLATFWLSLGSHWHFGIRSSSLVLASTHLKFKGTKQTWGGSSSHLFERLGNRTVVNHDWEKKRGGANKHQGSVSSASAFPCGYPRCRPALCQVPEAMWHLWPEPHCPFHRTPRSLPWPQHNKDPFRVTVIKRKPLLSG